jgi:tetratricopeptide (TPR) repeat protein
MELAGVPFEPQEGRGCGPASLSMMLGWSGVEVAHEALAADFPAKPQDPRRALPALARSYGRLPYAIHGIEPMLAEVAAGHPVLVVENLGVASRPMWNCAVVVGWDQGDDRILVNRGDTAGKAVPVSLFRRLWAETDEWGMVVMRPGELPATASAREYLAQARELEKAGRAWEAVLAFDAALSQWPQEAGALAGLGSSLKALGDLKGAVDAYKAAATLAPDQKPVQDTLAQAEAELQHREELAAAAPKALPPAVPARWEKLPQGLD